jgi:short-subunit dehydrogenase
MNQKLKGKVAVITGASKGIGRATALLFARQGADVVLAARSEEKLKELRDEIKKFDVKVLVVPTDVTRKEDIDNLIKRTADEFGRIDILLNNAGKGIHGRVAMTPYSDIEEILNVNLYGPIYCMCSVLPQMLRQGTGQIINISSVVGKQASPNNAAYCAAKFGLQGFSGSLRAELAMNGIDVIVVCPSTTDTEFFNEMKYVEPRRPRSFPTNTPEHVAKVILKASLKRKHQVVVSLNGKLVVLFSRFFPRVMDRIMAIVARRSY